MAELLGKQAGYCKGRGGGMHIADFSVGNLGANAIVGGSMAIATGAALAADRLGEKRVVVCCVGDGAMNNGIAHESMNFATMAQFEHGLPVIFFVENNQYGMTGQQKGRSRTSSTSPSAALGYNAEGMHAETICGMNVLSVRDALRRAQGAVPEGRGAGADRGGDLPPLGPQLQGQGDHLPDRGGEGSLAEVRPGGLLPGAAARDRGPDRGGRGRRSGTRPRGARSRPRPRARSRAGTRDPKDMFDGLCRPPPARASATGTRPINLLKEARSIPRDSEGKILCRHAVIEALTEEMIRDRRVCV